MKKTTLISTLLFILASCSNPSSKIEDVLDDAKENKKELEAVLDFYKKKPLDSLKYKSAVYLIENMKGHSSYKPLSGFEDAFDSISNYPMGDSRSVALRKIMDSVSKNTVIKKPELILDCQYVTSKYLINNIEFSYNAWTKVPKNKRASFENFCNYILPYKSGNEPIEEDSRIKLAKKYAWVSHLLNKGTPLNIVVDSVSSLYNFENVMEVRDYYPQPLSISQLEKIKFGACDDGVNYLLNVFRSLGIVSARDAMLHWGNHPSRGHSWLYVKYGNEEYSTDVRGKVDLKKKYIGESMPKVMRDTYEYIGNNAFQPNVKDVTKEYTPTVNVTISNVLDAPNTYPLLCVFDIDTEWAPITLGYFKDGNFNYDKIGVNTLYMAASVEDKKIVPVNYPFFIDKNKKIKFFKPNISVLKPVIITRKYPLSSPRSQREIDWIKSLDGCVFQGANNPNFDDATTIYKISSFNSTHAKKIVLKQTKKFKYVRFYSNKKESFLAKLAFYDNKGVQLKGEPIKENNRDSKWDIGAYDDDPLSFSGGTDFSLGLILSEQKNIGAIEFQPRTDNNHINVGEKYELRYWNKGWKTLGVQTAKDTVLYYNAPENSLLWLKNLTGGKQEHVFITDKNKKQQWLGSDNY